MRELSFAGRRRRIVVGFASALIFCVAVFFPGARLSAQVDVGINGTVTDAGGAVVSGATIAIQNLATGIVSNTVSNSAGTFIVPALSPGHYSVTVNAAGFRTIEQRDVTVEVGKMTTLAFQMMPGTVGQTVQVQGQALTLNTTDPELGTTVEPLLVKAAPIEISGTARQIDAFVFLAPGVQGNTWAKTINGGADFESEVEFNGVPAVQVETPGLQTLFNPPFELVNEFRVVSSAFSAQYGLAQGVVTYQMASGTNRLHGDAFEILRNQVFDSSGFYPSNFNAKGDPIPPINQENNFGFSVGGPVVLPKIYNGKNRTFFYFADDIFRQNEATNSLGSVPTVAMKGGDFSHFVDATGAMIPIYDPLTGEPFPGNIIPTARFSSVANSVIPMIPDPDRTGINGGNAQNEGPGLNAVHIKQNLWGYTIDHKLTNSQSIRFTQWRDILNTVAFGYSNIVPLSNPLSSAVFEPSLGSGWLLNYVKTFTPHLVMTAGASVLGAINQQNNTAQGVTFPGVTGSFTYPVMSFDGQNSPSWWGTQGTNLTNRKLGIAVVNNWLWNKGRNTYNIGIEYRRLILNDNECAVACGGQFNFTQRTTSVPDPNDPNFSLYGSSFASFLLGEVDSASRTANNAIHTRSYSWSPYIEDDIKLNNRLTVNLGLRWDILVPFKEVTSNDITYFNPNIPNSGADNLLGAATKLGYCTGCANTQRADIHWGYVDPRIGFAYELNNKTVIRSGFFMSTMSGGAYQPGDNRVGQDYGIILNGTFYRNSNGTSIPAYGSWDGNPLPALSPVPFSPTVGNASVLYGFDVKKSGIAPYDMAWNVGVQRYLGWNTYLTASYVGNRDVHLPSALNPYNQLDPAYSRYGSLLGAPANSPEAQAAGIKIPYANFLNDFGSSASVLQALLPYPQYAGITNNFDYTGSAFYNAVQMQGEKRYSNGLSFLAAVTLSRNMANVTYGFSAFEANPLNKFDQQLEWAPSSNDQKYVTKFVATYELPIGPGRALLNSNSVVNRIIGGWQISTILDYEGGYAFGVGEPGNPINTGNRPYRVPGINLHTNSYTRAKDYLIGKLATPPLMFPTDAFTLTNPFVLGDSKPRYAGLRTAPLRTEAFNAIKNFSIAEGIVASLRFDYFNAFNRTQLAGPDNYLTDSTYGVVTNPTSQIQNRQGQVTFRVEF